MKTASFWYQNSATFSYGVWGKVILGHDPEKQAMGKGFPVSQMMLGKLTSHVQKAEIGPLPGTLHYNSLQMD